MVDSINIGSNKLCYVIILFRSSNTIHFTLNHVAFNDKLILYVFKVFWYPLYFFFSGSNANTILKIV